MKKIKTAIETILVGILFIGIAFIGNYAQAEVPKSSSLVTCAELMEISPDITTEMLVAEIEQYETFYWLLTQMPDRYIKEWGSALNYVCVKSSYTVEDTVAFMVEETYEKVFHLAKGA